MRNLSRHELIKLLILLSSIAGITIIVVVLVYFIINSVPCDSGGGS